MEQQTMPDADGDPRMTIAAIVDELMSQAVRGPATPPPSAGPAALARWCDEFEAVERRRAALWAQVGDTPDLPPPGSARSLLLFASGALKQHSVDDAADWRRRADEWRERAAEQDQD